MDHDRQDVSTPATVERAADRYTLICDGPDRSRSARQRLASFRRLLPTGSMLSGGNGDARLSARRSASPCVRRSAAGVARQIAVEHAMSNTTLLPFQPDAMTPAQLAAVSCLARYSGHTHDLYAYQLRRWFEWCETNRLDPLVSIQRAHVELYIRHLGDCGLMPFSINTMMHGCPRVLPVRPHRRSDPRRPGRLRSATEDRPGRITHPRARQTRADPVPASCPDRHRAPRRPGVPAGHQRSTCL